MCLFVVASVLAEGASVEGVDDAAAHDGLENGDFGELFWRDFGEVVGKNDEIGVLAGFEFALLPFLELGVSGAGGVGADAVVEGDFLLALPAAGRTAFGKFTGDTSIEAAHRGDGFDWIVGAESQASAAFRIKTRRA